MTASPYSPHGDRARPAVELLAFVGDAAGAAPSSLTDAAPWLLPIDFQHVSGGDLNTCTLQIDLDTLDSRYQDILVPVEVDRTVEIREVRNGNVDTLFAWGKLATNSISVNDRQESSTITCRLDPTALELKLLTYHDYYDDDADQTVKVYRDLVFNPVHEGVVVGNRSTAGDDDGAFHFLSHWSVKTIRSLALQQQAPKRWTLAEAVHRLCWYCNPDEERLTNPTITDLRNTLDDTERDTQFRNHTIPLGSTLFDALDALLRPYSCSWRLKWSGALGSVVTEIEIFELGRGLEEPLRIQRLGDTIHNRRTNVADVKVDFDITAQPNRIIAVSGLRQLEVEINLYPAWDPADDPLGVSNGFLDEYDELANGDDYQLGEKKEHVGRKWAANEAGDYNGFRSSQTTAQVLPQTVRRVRRPMLPCLTRARDGQLVGNRGYVLDWQDFADEWHEVQDAYRVATDEAAIWFTELPPVEIWNEYLADKENYGLKITATIVLDDRVLVETNRRSDSPQGQDHWLYLDLSSEYAEKRLDMSSPFYADRKFALVSAGQDINGDWDLILDRDPVDVLNVGQKIAALDNSRENVYTVKEMSGVTIKVQEDASAIATSGAAGNLVFANTDCEGCGERLTQTANKARDDNDYALVAPTFELHGIDHPEYEIGKLVPNAQPRNVSFAGRRGGSRSPQIVAINYVFHGRQRTTLILEQFRGSLPAGMSAAGSPSAAASKLVSEKSLGIGGPASWMTGREAAAMAHGTKISEYQTRRANWDDR